MARKPISRRERRAVESRARRRCEYCHAPARAMGVRLHIEHVVPVAIGGPDRRSNYALCCPSCNLSKAARTSATDPVTGVIVPLYNPRHDVWDEHFAWSKDRFTVRGRTAIGRATVAALNMNDRELWFTARRLWFANGLLP
jgi:HNH endonuclease